MGGGASKRKQKSSADAIIDDAGNNLTNFSSEKALNDQGRRQLRENDALETSNENFLKKYDALNNPANNNASSSSSFLEDDKKSGTGEVDRMIQELGLDMLETNLNGRKSNNNGGSNTANNNNNDQQQKKHPTTKSTKIFFSSPNPTGSNLGGGGRTTTTTTTKVGAGINSTLPLIKECSRRGNKVDFAEFSTMMELFCGAKNIRTFLDRIFSYFDKDGDGILNNEEFCVAATNLGNVNATERARVVLMAHDADHDDCLTSEELGSAISHHIAYALKILEETCDFARVEAEVFSDDLSIRGIKRALEQRARGGVSGSSGNYDIDGDVDHLAAAAASSPHSSSPRSFSSPSPSVMGTMNSVSKSGKNNNNNNNTNNSKYHHFHVGIELTGSDTDLQLTLVTSAGPVSLKVFAAQMLSNPLTSILSDAVRDAMISTIFSTVQNSSSSAELPSSPTSPTTSKLPSKAAAAKKGLIRIVDLAPILADYGFVSWLSPLCPKSGPTSSSSPSATSIMRTAGGGGAGGGGMMDLGRGGRKVTDYLDDDDDEAEIYSHEAVALARNTVARVMR